MSFTIEQDTPKQVILLEFEYDRYGHRLLPGILSVDIKVSTRKMRAHWTPELVQDLEIIHSIAEEAKLTTTILNIQYE